MRRGPAAVVALCALLACGDDEPAAPRVHVQPDASPQPTAAERGKYLVEAVAACGMCHTPRKADGSFDEAKQLSGVECLIDLDSEDAARGCMHSRNLTAHETGLQNRSDEEIADMFRKGERPDGKPVHPFMPYWALGNMRDEDAEAIVAYLRSVPGVEHMLPPSEPPFRTPERAAERWPLEQIPEPPDAAPERAAALRGRYLAAEVGLCMACHTPRGDDGSPVYANAFQGGRQLMAAQFEWATPSIAGLGAGAIDALAMKIKHAHGPALCPDPAPLGQSPFEALRDEDARDIAHYLASLPPSPTTTPAVCRSTAGR